MKLGLFNARGINKTEHFIPLEIEELQKQGHEIRHFWIKGKHPTKEDVEWMDFAVYHFVPTAMFFHRLRLPFCILPTANDIFPNNGFYLKVLEGNPNCKFIGYQSYYHKSKYDEWGISKPTVHIPHCCRVDLFKRKKPLGKKIIAGGRLIPKKGLDRIVPYIDDLVVFGDGPLKDELESLNSNVEFTGFLEGEDLRALMDEAWLYLYPAIITLDGDSDGIPNTLKEALLMQLQVAANPVAGIPEIMCVHMVSDWKHPKKVVSSIPHIENNIGRQEILDKFSPDICCNKLIQGIEEYGFG